GDRGDRAVRLGGGGGREHRGGHRLRLPRPPRPAALRFVERAAGLRDTCRGGNYHGHVVKVADRGVYAPVWRHLPRFTPSTGPAPRAAGTRTVRTRLSRPGGTGSQWDHYPGTAVEPPRAIQVVTDTLSGSRGIPRREIGPDHPGHPEAFGSHAIVPQLLL